MIFDSAASADGRSGLPPGEGGSEFDEADLQKWTRGTARFREFWQSIKDRVSTEVNKDHPDFRTLEAMFLGEKPVVINAYFSDEFKTELEQQGLVVEKQFIYDREQAQSIIDKDKDYFVQHLGESDADKVMKKIIADPIIGTDESTEEKEIMLGLLLGYPKSSVKEYAGGFKNSPEQRKWLQIRELVMKLFEVMGPGQPMDALQRLYVTSRGNERSQEAARVIAGVIKVHQKQLGLDDRLMPRVEADLSEHMQRPSGKNVVNVYGVVWVDPDNPQQDSLDKQRRLKAAFEKSSILEVVKEKYRKEVEKEK